MKVALVHDWLLSDRGGEKVLEKICQLFPEAEIFTLFHVPNKIPVALHKHEIHTSFLNKLPASGKYYRHLLPLYPMAIERFNFAGFDLVISSSHCVAKAVVTPPDVPHICYCHTPMRYIWDRYSDYFAGKKTEKLIAPIIHYLRTWDTATSVRVDHFIANSHWVKKRIEKYYRRNAEVLHPPVDTDYFQLPKNRPSKDYFLAVSAFAPYKRIDLAIAACTQLKKKLLIIGDGQDDKKLKKLNSPFVEFLGRVDRNKLRSLYQNASALLFPGEEDFGITPVEAMACGTPIIAYGKGGLRETVIHAKTGVFFKDQTVQSLVEAISAFNEINFDSQVCRTQAELFSEINFLNGFTRLLKQALESYDWPSSGLFASAKDPSASSSPPAGFTDSTIC